MIGGVEGGGTKFLAAVAEPSTESTPPRIVDQIRVDTGDVPERTLDSIGAWLADRSPVSLGIATFGPVDLAAGTVRTTPKPGWSGAAVMSPLAAKLAPGVPVGFDTDVNGAALAEWTWGAARGTDVAVYLTIGTGVGGGIVVDGSPIHGEGHPEIGHVAVPTHPDDDPVGSCPYHSQCLEGRVSGTALARRAGRPAREIEPDAAIWDEFIFYVARALADLALVVSPQVVVLGGGVMQRPELIERIGDELGDVVNGYIDAPRLVPPHFGQEAGLFGALALAEAALDRA